MSCLSSNLSSQAFSRHRALVSQQTQSDAFNLLKKDANATCESPRKTQAETASAGSSQRNSPKIRKGHPADERAPLAVSIEHFRHMCLEGWKDGRMWV